MTVKELRAALDVVDGCRFGGDVVMENSDGGLDVIHVVREGHDGTVSLCVFSHQEGLDVRSVCPRDLKCIQAGDEGLVDRVSGKKI